MQMNLNNCIAFVQRELTPKRFEHSLGVMNVMSELATVFALDEATAMVAGILHDVAKEFPAERQLAVARKNKIALVREHDEHPLFLHGPVGACYIAEELGITNPVILDTIVHHSYFGNGVALSPLLCWCLRFADVLEPSRDWQNIRTQLQPLVYAKKVKEGAYLLMKWAIPFHESVPVPVHPNMQRVFQELSVLMEEETSGEIAALPV